jgi:glycosyltransferase involved in cell wall biosynthesis
MKLSVMIPTYGRSDALKKCLNGLAKQTRAADQIIIVIRPDDEASNAIYSEWNRTLPLTRVSIDRSGVVQALNAGLTHVTGDIVTITDDDSIAYPDWLARIEDHFAQDPHLGGLGGRDVVHLNEVAIPASARLVGRVLPFGRVVGNHHIGLGKAREVDHPKGVNMSWRMAAVGAKRLDSDLRGEGAQVHFELGLSLAIKSSGWRLVYDPAVLVDHYPAPRFDSDQRNAPSLRAVEDASFNLYLLLLRYMPSGWRRRTAIAWARIIGTEKAPGVLRGVAYSLTNNRDGIAFRTSAIRAWNAAESMHEQQ